MKNGQTNPPYPILLAIHKSLDGGTRGELSIEVEPHIQRGPVGVMYRRTAVNYHHVVMGTHHHSTVTGSSLVSTLFVQCMDLRIDRTNYEAHSTYCTMYGSESIQSYP